MQQDLVWNSLRLSYPGKMRFEKIWKINKNETKQKRDENQHEIIM